MQPYESIFMELLWCFDVFFDTENTLVKGANVNPVQDSNRSESFRNKTVLDSSCDTYRCHTFSSASLIQYIVKSF